MEKVIEILRSHKIKATPQRIGVYEILKHAGHMTAEELYCGVRAKMPAMSLGTVYSVVKTFCEAGLIREIKMDSDRAIFDITPEQHCHFFCKNCHQVKDLPENGFHDFKPFKLKGCQIKDYHVNFYGFCEECSKKQGELCKK